MKSATDRYTAYTLPIQLHDNTDYMARIIRETNPPRKSMPLTRAERRHASKVKKDKPKIKINPLLEELVRRSTLIYTPLTHANEYRYQMHNTDFKKEMK